LNIPITPMISFLTNYLRPRSLILQVTFTALLAIGIAPPQASAADPASGPGTPPSSSIVITRPHAGATQSDSHSEEAKEKERKLIATIKSDAPSADKAVPCKLLAVYGSRDAVPALAALLPDPQLSSWARIALEAIPDPSADEALRAAMPKVQGLLLVGVINSIGNRHDTKAVGALVKRLQDPDPAVASAAAVALGHIGDAKAAKALVQDLPKAPATVRPAVAYGTVLCAEKLLAQGKRSDAVKLYDLVRKADVPKQDVLDAIRGAILARGSAGLPLLLEQLRSTDKELTAIGLRTARELPGRDVTEALATEIHRAAPARQAYLLLALADRSDPAVTPAVLDAAKNGSTSLRLVAVGILDRQGNLAGVPVLLDAAASGDTALSQASMTALARLPGNSVDSELMAQFSRSSGKSRQVLIELAAQRRVEAALPVVVQSTADSDAGVRKAAVSAIGVMGDCKQAAGLVKLLTATRDSKESAEIESALIGISSRGGAACAPQLLPLAQNRDAALRIIGLHVLVTTGGPEALAAVKALVEDSDESVRDEAVRTLATWPNNWPEDAGVAEPLLALARSGKTMSQQVLGMRGYLQYIKGDKALGDDQKVSKVSEVTSLLKRPEEKRLAIAAIDGIPTASGLDLLVTFAAEPAVADDACSAILSVTGKSVPGITKEQRQKGLEAVAANSTNADTKKKAEELLKKLS